MGLDSGIDAWKSEGLLEYFGRTRSVAGRATGDKLDKLKAKHALCVIHEQGNIALEAAGRGEEDVRRRDQHALCERRRHGRGGRRRHGQTAQGPEASTKWVILGAQFALAAVDVGEVGRQQGPGRHLDLNSSLVKSIPAGTCSSRWIDDLFPRAIWPWTGLVVHSNGNFSGGGTASVCTRFHIHHQGERLLVAKFAANESADRPPPALAAPRGFRCPSRCVRSLQDSILRASHG